MAESGTNPGILHVEGPSWSLFSLDRAVYVNTLKLKSYLATDENTMVLVYFGFLKGEVSNIALDYWIFKVVRLMAKHVCHAHLQFFS
jgi:hypothetical protein